MWLKTAMHALKKALHKPKPGELGYYMKVSVSERSAPAHVLGQVHIDSSTIFTLSTPQGDTIIFEFEDV